MTGEDWFEVGDEQALSWAEIRRTVDAQQQRLSEVIEGVEAGGVTCHLTAEERFGLVLGITCHAVYHAGQVQLIKRLHGEQRRGVDSCDAPRIVASVTMPHLRHA
jgi:hypothetical protein